jgi:hypothetical protein
VAIAVALVPALLLAAVGVLSGALVGATHRGDAATAAVQAAKASAATAAASAQAQLQQVEARASHAAAQASTAEAAQSSAAEAAQVPSGGSTSDQKFLAAVAAGAPDLRAAAPGSQLINSAHALCALLGNESLTRAEARTLATSTVETQGWDAAQAATLVDASISAYCPGAAN